MSASDTRPHPVWLVFCLVLAAPPAPPPAVAVELAEEVEYCLACHDDETLTLELEDGSEMSLHVSPEAFAGSVHGGELFCTDCHRGYDDHPSGVTFPSERQYVIDSYEVCRSCHFDAYTRNLEGVHFELLSQGSRETPVCSDCHGAHDIHDPRQKQTMISQSCATCHQDVFDAYAASVHGRAMFQETPDVPGCADCHTAHSVKPPNGLEFHLASPKICIDCHGDEAMMERHGLATTIASTYLTDFHGVTATLADPAEVEPEEVVVVCVDCHGIHDIASPSAVGVEPMKRKVEQTCARCHEGAPESFPAAWLSHYPPSLSNAPLVFLVIVFYRVAIPFIILGLILQIFLHLYRVGIRR